MQTGSFPETRALPYADRWRLHLPAMNWLESPRASPQSRYKRGLFRSDFPHSWQSTPRLRESRLPQSRVSNPSGSYASAWAPYSVASVSGNQRWERIVSRRLECHASSARAPVRRPSTKRNCEHARPSCASPAPGARRQGRYRVFPSRAHKPWFILFETVAARHRVTFFWHAINATSRCRSEWKGIPQSPGTTFPPLHKEEGSRGNALANRRWHSAAPWNL